MANGDDLNFQGLLSDPGFNLGVGLLGAGLSRPQSFGEGLLSAFGTAGDLQGQALANKTAREQLRELSRQRQRGSAVKDLISSLAPQAGFSRALDATAAAGGQPGPTRAAAALGEQLSARAPLSGLQSRAIGLLAEASPTQALQTLTQRGGVLGPPVQERAETSLVRNLRAAGVEPGSEQGREIILSTLTRDPGVTDQQLALLQTQLRAMQVQQMQREMQREERTEEQRRGQLITDLRSDLNQAEELAQLNERLQNTLLETGIPFSDFRGALASGIDAAKRLFGISDQEAQSLIADFDRFNKLATDFAVQSAVRMFDQGALTNFQLQSVQDAQVSPTIAPSANARVIADSIESLLAGADNLGVEIKDRQRFETLARQLRDAGGQVETSQGDIPRFDTQQAAEAAFERGQIQIGDVITINGRRVRVEE